VISSKLVAPAVGAVIALCCAGLGGVAVASSAAPQTPASTATPTGTTTPTGATTPATAILSSRVVRFNLLVGHDVAMTGAIDPTLGRQIVALQEHGQHGWFDVAQSRSLPSGDFGVRFRSTRLGSFAVRVAVAGLSGLPDVTSTPERVNVYHQVLASWYGPGGTTACGQQLTATMLGVANKTLPCGTLVTFRYHHRYLRVPVIDRGPYVAGRDFDLTYATKQALGAGDLTVVWANH